MADQPLSVEPGQVALNGWVKVSADGKGVVSHAGIGLLREMAEQTGLVEAVSSALMGTYKGAVRQEHLDAYLGEFCFRFNRRDNLHAAFQTILGISPKVEGPTWKGLYSGEFRHPNPGTKVAFMPWA